MEDCAVSEAQALEIRAATERRKLDKVGWKNGWTASGIHLCDRQVEADFQEALRWFREHPTYISPDIEDFFPEECVGCYRSMGFPITADINDPRRMGLYVSGGGQLCPQCSKGANPPVRGVTDQALIDS